MNLHEYQAKKLLEQYGMPVGEGEVIFSTDEAINIANQLGGHAWVAKAQVHAGGRGKAGGVKILKSKEALADFVKELLGKR